MQQIEVNSRKFMIVEVPEGFENITVEGKFVFIDTDKYYWDRSFTLPDGKYMLIGKLEIISEEQWAGIMETVATMGKKGTNSYAALWRNYEHNIPQQVFLTCSTATESGHSLLRANNIPLQNRLLIEIV